MKKLTNILSSHFIYIAFALGIIGGSAAEREEYLACVVIVLLFWFTEYLSRNSDDG